MAKSRPDRGNILENRELLPGILAIASPQAELGRSNLFTLILWPFLCYLFIVHFCKGDKNSPPISENFQSEMTLKVI